MNILKEKIEKREAVIAVIGLGYTGLPLALAFADTGFRVVGVDINERKISLLQSGKSYVEDVTDQEVAKCLESGRFSVVNSQKIPNNVDCIIICVPTPLNKTKDPDVSFILHVAEEIKNSQNNNLLIVLQSTTYPGTTKELILPILEETGFIVGKDFYLSFSPERLDPGNKTYTTKNIPRIVGGVTKNCAEITKKLFSAVVDQVYTVSSADAAETVKLLENTFRSVNIAMINEMAIMCDKMSVDIWEVIKAASTKPFGFMPFYPGPGIGGHCIPVDPHYLSWKLKMLNYKARFVELAGEINSEMPEFIVKKSLELLNQNEKSAKGSSILLIGLTYKRDSDDYRESPSIDVMGMLEAMGAKVRYSDHYVPELYISDKSYRSVNLTKKILNAQDLTIILTDHSNVDYDRIFDNTNLIFDTRNVYANRKSKKIYKL